MRKIYTSSLSCLVSATQSVRQPIFQYDNVSAFVSRLFGSSTNCKWGMKMHEEKVESDTLGATIDLHSISSGVDCEQATKLEADQYAPEKDVADMESMFLREGIPAGHFARVCKGKRMTVSRLNGVYQLMEVYQEIGASRLDCLRAVARQPKIADLPVKDEVEADVLFFRNLGVTFGGVERLLSRMPEVLLVPKDEIKRKLDYFSTLSLSDSEIAEIISKNGCFLICSLERNIQLKAEFFRSLGLMQVEVGLVFLRMPQIFRLSVEKQIKRNILLFERAGASNENIKHMIKNCPRLLGLSRHNHLDIKLWFAQHVMNKSTDEIFRYLPFFTLSLDNRILFRAAFLRRIKKDFRKKSLKATFGGSVKKFNDLFGQNQVDRFEAEWEYMSRKERIMDACGIQWNPES